MPRLSKFCLVLDYDAKQKMSRNLKLFRDCELFKIKKNLYLTEYKLES